MPDSIIHILPDTVVSQIAAGEVIQRPSSVIKELMENAVDAGATKIDVSVKDFGKNCIRVADNGKGMSREDAEMAFVRHATSKLNTVDDLFALRTMGFRGEALASIASISQVELVTRRAQDELGWKINVEGAEVVNEEPEMSAQGSSLVVRNIFYNVPARRRFLSNNRVLLKQIKDEFVRIALVNCSVEMTLSNNGEVIYSLPASGLKQRISFIFKGRNSGSFSNMLYQLEVNTQLVNITGFIGDPSVSAKRDPAQYFFVNNRYFEHKYFRSAVMKAYENLLPPGDYPPYFIFMDVDPASLDVNIHPTKIEVKFEEEKAIWPIIFAAVREALGKFDAMPSIDFDKEDAPDIDVYTGDKTNVKVPGIKFNPNYNPFKNNRTGSANGSNGRSGMEFFEDLSSEKLSGTSDEPSGKIFESFENYFNNEEKDNIFSDNGNEFLNTGYGERADHQESFSSCFKAKASRTQLFSSYILLCDNRFTVVVDQHRAHVRVLYDLYKRKSGCNDNFSQSLLFPVELRLDPDQIADLKLFQHDFESLGFGFDFNGKVCVASVPLNSEKVDPESLVLDLLKEANEIGLMTGNRIDKLALKLAYRASVPSGKVLSKEEMDYIISELANSDNNRFTPDGKVICVNIFLEDIRSKF